MIQQFGHWFRTLLNSPTQVIFYSLGLVFFALVLDGSLFQYWTMVRENERLEKSIRATEKQSEVLQEKIKMAKSLEFIEHQARDRLDLVNSDELVFVFADDINMLQ